MSERVVIGIDPAKRSHAFEVIDGDERTLAAAVIVNDNAGYRDMLAAGRLWPDRQWAVEGAGGVGRQLAQRLVADGETVIDVPAKLSARVRAMTTGHGRKNDPTDARAVAIVGLRNHSLARVTPDDETVALRLMSERRRDLVRTRTQTVNRLHQLLMELIPAGAQRSLTASKARALLATVRPRDVAGKARRQLAADYIDDITILDRKLKALDKRIAEAVKTTGTSLTDDHRHRPGHRRADPRRSRQHRPLPVQGSLRQLHRHRTVGSLQRRRRPPPAFPGRQPAAQPCAAHRRPVAEALRRTRACLLHPQTRRRQRQQRCAALPETTTVRRRLPAPRRRPDSKEPGRANGGVYSIQRG